MTFFGGLRHVHAPAYEAVIALANAVAAAVERAANARNFAVCTYVKDGFWGAFGDAAPEVVPREAALAAALALRDDCQRAAEAVLRAAGLHPQKAPSCTCASRACSRMPFRGRPTNTGSGTPPRGR